MRMVSELAQVETFQMNSTTPEPMKGVSSSVGPEAQLMLLQLLTQVKFLQDICKPNNISSPGEEALSALARDAIGREQDAKRQLETLELTSKETVSNLTAELNDITQQLNIAQELNKNLSESLKNKEEEMQELQRKMEELNNGRAKKLQEVLKGQTKEDALIKAARRGNTEELRIILDSQVNLEYSTRYPKWTALEWAVAFGHTQACRLLLERVSNPNTINTRGMFAKLRWPLQVAARLGQLEIASLLLQYGADASDKEPETLARDRGYLELAQLLCEWKNKDTCRYLADRHC